MGKDKRPRHVGREAPAGARLPRRTRVALPAFALVVIVLIGLVVTGRFTQRSAGPAPPGARPLNLLLVTIDTLRADRVGRGLTPAFDALASRGTFFPNARTVAPLTLPAHVSLMTGLLPTRHGVRLNGAHRFDGTHPTIASLLHAAGYQTAAFVGAYVLDRRFGLAGGFDVYDDRIVRSGNAVARLEAERPANLVADAAIAWVEKVAADRPFFLWVHFYDAHAPYTPPPDYLRRANGQPYDGEVAFADAQLARVVDALTKSGRSGETVVAVVGDHGESLGDHGEATHGMLVFEGALRVPMAVAGPGVRVTRDDATVSIVDLPRTLLGRVASNQAPNLPGSDLLSPKRQPSDLYSETEYPKVNGWSPACALLEGRWKLIQSPVAKLFDLRADPAERQNVAASHSSVVTAMTGRLARIRSASRAATVPAVSADLASRLRALGYVASSVSADTPAAAPDPADVIDGWRQFDDAQNALMAGDYARALPMLARLAASHPESSTFASSYVTALQESGSVRRALEVARATVSKHSNDAGLFHALAVAARDAGLPDESLRAERAALALSPDDPVVHNGLGLLAVDKRQPADAAAAFERATTLDPTNAQYWTNLGNARREVGDQRAAEQAYRRALDIDRFAADAANGLGVLLVQAGQAGDAIAWFERALSRDSSFYEARLNLGIACEQAGDAKRAAQAYRAVLGAPARFTREREGASRLLAQLERGHKR